MRDKRKSNFRDKVVGDARRQQTSRVSYGYLNLPKGVNVFSPTPNSRVMLDFLPYVVSDPHHPDRNPEDERAEVGTLWYKRPFKIHRRGIGIEGDSVVCLTSVGKKCPICEYRQKRLREGAPKIETDKLKPSLRNLYVVVPIGHRDYDEKPHIFDMSQWLFQNLLNEELDDNPDNGIFPSLDEGLTLKIRFGSDTAGNSQPFPRAERIDFIEREKQYGEDILKSVPDLDKVLQILSYEELQAKFFEIEGEEDGGRLKDEDDLNMSRKPKTSLRFDDDGVIHKSKSISQDEDEDEDKPASLRSKNVLRDEDEEDQEEKMPSTRTRARFKDKDEEERDDVCPFKHKFGRDFDEYPDDCDVCDKWDACMEANKKYR